MWSWEQMFGGIVAVIVAGMPAMIALMKIKELHVLINSRLSELIEATAKASHSEGQMEGRKDGRDLVDTEASRIICLAADKAKLILELAESKAKSIVSDAARSTGGVGNHE